MTFVLGTRPRFTITSFPHSRLAPHAHFVHAHGATAMILGFLRHERISFATLIQSLLFGSSRRQVTGIVEGKCGQKNRLRYPR
jgi:hypothetical protein